MNKGVKIFIIIFLCLNLLFITLYCLCKYVFMEEIVNTIKNNYISYSLYDSENVLKILLKNEKYTNKLNYQVIEEEKNIEDNTYVEEILVNNTDNKDYKYIKTNINGYNAHLVVIYDPSKVKLITSASFNTGNSQETVLNICKRVGATIGINGGGFVDYGSGSDIPIGYLIKDSKIIWSDSKDNSAKANLIGFNKDNKLTLVNASGVEAIDMGIRDALQFGPFLIVDGKSMDMSHDVTGGYSGAARVAIAQRQDGIVMFLVTEGMHGRGPTLSDVQKFLKQRGAYNAANLDGGASSQLVVSGTLINRPLNIYGEVIYGGRRVVSGFGMVR